VARSPAPFPQIRHQLRHRGLRDNFLRVDALCAGAFDAPVPHRKIFPAPPVRHRPPRKRHRHAIRRGRFRVARRRHAEIAAEEPAHAARHLLGDLRGYAVHFFCRRPIDAEQFDFLCERVSRNTAEKKFRRARYRRHARLHVPRREALRHRQHKPRLLQHELFQFRRGIHARHLARLARERKARACAGQPCPLFSA
jgi:hypothetical protein